MKTLIIAALAAALPGAVLAQGQAASPKVVREVEAERALIQRVQQAQAQAGAAKARQAEVAEKILANSAGLIKLMGEDPRIDVDLDNAPVRDALKQIFERAKLDYQVDEEVPSDARITLRAKNVRFLTALELVLQGADAGLVREMRDGKASYRIRKGGGTNPLGALLLRPNVIGGGGYLAPGGKGGSGLFTPDQKGLVPVPKLQEYLKTFSKGGGVTPYIYQFNEQRSTFRCPHCKGQSTVIRQSQQPKCEKCSRTFQPDWQFCPADGAKRPAAAAEWRYCPFCGKRTEGEKAGAEPFGKEPDVFGFDLGRQF
jgi:hypothetical protein